MALNPGETQSGGTVRDTDGRLVVAIVSGVSPHIVCGGAVRDADGRRVVVCD